MFRGILFNHKNKILLNASVRSAQETSTGLTFFLNLHTMNIGYV